MREARLIGPEEKDFFNAFVENSPKPHFLQTYEWGELKRTTGWEFFPLMTFREGRPVAAALLLKRPLPLGLSFFYAPRGPILGWDCSSEDEDFFWEEVKRLARRHRGVFVKVDPDVPRSDAAYAEMLARRGFRPAGARGGFGGLQPRFVFRLDLGPSPEEILARMAPKTRYNIRLAARKGVRVRPARDKEDLAVFYAILLETARRDGFLVRSYSYFEKMWDLFVARGKARLFLAEYLGEVLAGALAFWCGDKVWYLYGASRSRHRNVMPNHLLQWEMICWARSLGCRVYDFRGVPPGERPGDPLAGLYRFKKGFGAEFTEFVGEHDLVLSPFWYFSWRTLLPCYQRLLRWGRRSSPAPAE